MTLGEKIRQARQALGISQRQLCGEEITRNMLSLIENGAASPSMKTLTVLAERLGKPVSYFLDETAPDPGELVASADNLRKARQAMEAGKYLYARQLLEGVTARELWRERLLLETQIPGAELSEIVRKLPSLDRELLLRAEVSMHEGRHGRCMELLKAVEDQTSVQYHFILGRLHMARSEWEDAARQLLPAESAYPEVIPMLETCFRELGDYKRAYEYACKQKK